MANVKVFRTNKRTNGRAKNYIPLLTNKVCNKESNEYLHGRNIRFEQDLNQGRLVEKPIP